MPGNYTIELELFSLLNGSVDGFEIYADGSLLSGYSSIVSSSGSTISLTVSYGGAMPSSLSFGFNDTAPGSTDRIEIRSVKINDKYVNTGNFLSTDTLNDGQTATVDVAAAPFLYDDSEPDASIFTTNATQTFTDGANRWRDYNGTNDEVFDLQDGNDNVDLGSGDDTVNGGNGRDTIKAGDGNDLIAGGADNDRLFGQDGNDTIYGGTGNDLVYGNEGNDELFGGDGNDAVIGHNGDDLLVGGTGEDRLNGGNGADELFGGEDDDQLIGGADNDTLDGGAGDDYLHGGIGNDILNGGADNDLIVGSLGLDIIHGDGGDDRIIVTTNDYVAGEEIYGGTGTDELILSGAVVADFTTGVLDGLETLTGNTADQDITYTFEQALGFSTIDLGDGNDTTRVNITGVADVTALGTPTTTNVENGFLTGSAGDDNLTISGGQLDALVFGSGIIDFGAGTNDTLNLTSTSTALNTLANTDGAILGLENINVTSAGGGVTIDLTSQTDDFTIDGSNFADNITTGSGDDTVDGGAGIDIINGGAGDDTLYGGAGNDTINASLAGTYTPAVTVADILAANPTLTYDAGTGNFYEFVDSGSTSVNYASAVAAAAAYTVNGVSAHLATITSAAEDSVIGGLVNGGRYGWIGLDDTATEGTFLWNAGPETGTGTGAYTNWTGGGGPSPNSATADNVLYWDGGGDVWYAWAGTNNAWGYVAEWEGADILVTETLTGFDSRTETNTLYGGDGDDTLNGSLGNDILNGGADNDILNGDTGNDTLDGGSGNDTINGGDGIDTVSFSSVTNGVTVDLDAGTATGDGTDTLSGIENITGSDFNDNLTGDDNDNVIIGGTGNDVISSGMGSDTIIGGDGNDILSSTSSASGTTVADILAAHPTLTYSAATGNFYEYVAGNTNYASAVTAVSNYTVNGVAGHLATITSAAEDAVIGGLVENGDFGWIGLDDTVTEGTFLWNTGPESGTGTGAYTNWWGGGGPNPNSATADNALYWDGGGDVWYAWRGTNTARGYIAEWEGADVLAGITNLSTETVSLSGGDGLDTLYGGAGIDTFIFEAASAFNDVDVIENFALGLGGDAIDISDVLSGFSGPITDYVNFVDNGGDTIVQVDSNGTAGGANFQAVATIVGVTGLDEATLFTDGNIIV